MNTRTSKLIITGGFGLSLLATVIQAFSYKMMMHGPHLIMTAINLLSLLGSLAIIGGFGLLFLSERDIIDLGIAGALGLSFLLSLIGILGALQIWIVSAAFLAWAYQLWTKNQMLGIAVAGTVVLNIVIQYVFPSLLLNVLALPQSAYIVTIYLFAIAINLVRIYAAYSDINQ